MQGAVHLLVDLQGRAPLRALLTGTDAGAIAHHAGHHLRFSSFLCFFHRFSSFLKGFSSILKAFGAFEHLGPWHLLQDLTGQVPFLGPAKARDGRGIVPQVVRQPILLF